MDLCHTSGALAYSLTHSLVCTNLHIHAHLCNHFHGQNDHNDNSTIYSNYYIRERVGEGEQETLNFQPLAMQKASIRLYRTFASNFIMFRTVLQCSPFCPKTSWLEKLMGCRLSWRSSMSNWSMYPTHYNIWWREKDKERKREREEKTKTNDVFFFIYMIKLHWASNFMTFRICD